MSKSLFAGVQVGVRDSKDIERGHLTFSASAWVPSPPRSQAGISTCGSGSPLNCDPAPG
ncbi:DUF397 domain-containing protein [Nocardia sp. NPDC057353]|uniref:DUF397 domain-containing protein n=1 Tax=Nocardia sp. NPDC057353 TaxID=3346104 RepID=UPI00362C7564